MKPHPVIAITATTRVTHASAPWRRWVTVRRGFSGTIAATYLFDQPYQKIARGEAARRDTWAPVLCDPTKDFAIGRCAPCPKHTDCADERAAARRYRDGK